MDCQTLTKTCSRCRVEKPRAGFYRGRREPDGLMRWCRECSNNNTNEQRRKQPEKYREYWQKRYRKLYGPGSERVDPVAVFERDGWRCKLCDVMTDRTLPGRSSHALAPEVDHIIPLSRGGLHTYKNTQCVCHKCNRAKGNKILGEQLDFVSNPSLIPRVKRAYTRRATDPSKQRDP